MYVHQVVIVPGYRDVPFVKAEKLEIFRRYGQFDLLNRCATYCTMRLNQEGVRNLVLTPDVNGEMPTPPASSIIVFLNFGWLDAKYKTNISSIYFSPEHSRELARNVMETLSEWGTCTVFGHRRANPKLGEEKHALPEGQMSLRCEPFCANGPYAAEYAARMNFLGDDLGRVLANFTQKHNWAASAGLGLKGPNIPTHD